MVAARIPDMITPAIIGGRSFPQTMMKMFSAPEEERSASSVGSSALPIIPIATAAKREMMTQTVAMRRLMVISEVFLAAIKRRRTWGIPKYPSPQLRVERTVMIP